MQISYQTKLTLSVSYYQTRVNTFSEFISNITGTLRELLPNNTTQFLDIKQHWHFQSYWQTITHNFPKITLYNIDIFRKLPANNTTNISGVYIKQHWHFQRVLSKLIYSKKFFRVHTTQYWHFQGVTTEQYWLI